MTVISITLASVFVGALALDDVSDAVSDLLKQKDKRFPYSAEYETAFPGAPDPLGRSVTVKFCASSRSSLYTEERTSTYTSRVLIEDGQAYWEYEDQGVGPVLFRGPANVREGTAQAFLERQGFPCNVFTFIDGSVCEQLRAWSLSGKVRSLDDKVMIEDARLGTIEVALTRSRVVMDRVGPKRQTLFRYSYSEGKSPAWCETGIASLRKKFKESDAKEIVCAESSDKFNFIDLMGSVANETSPRSIAVAGLPSVAKKVGYYLPAVGDVVAAEGVATARGPKQLALTVKHRGSTYDILQMIPGITRNDLPRGSVKKERKVPDYDVLIVEDPGTRARLTYYVGKEVTFILTGEFFDDSKLDGVVQSFKTSKK